MLVGFCALVLFDSVLWKRPLHSSFYATLKFFHMLIFVLAVVGFENALM